MNRRVRTGAIVLAATFGVGLVATASGRPWLEVALWCLATALVAAAVRLGGSGETLGLAPLPYGGTRGARRDVQVISHLVTEADGVSPQARLRLQRAATAALEARGVPAGTSLEDPRVRELLPHAADLYSPTPAMTLRAWTRALEDLERLTSDRSQP